MKKILFFLITMFMLSACASAPPPITAELPIAVPCHEPPVIVRPHLQISDLKDTDAPDVVIRAYVMTVETLKGYASSLEVLLDGYRK